MTPALAMLLLTAAPGAACDAAPAAEVAVRSVANAIVAADNARDLERVLGLYSKDAVLMPPGEAIVAGIAAIRPRYETLFAGFDPAIEGTIDEACVAGGVLAYVRGHNGGRLVGRGTTPSRDLDDVYLMVLARETGEWRITRLIWHRASPAR